jgi:two-component system, cell cycle response regulator
MARVIVIEDNAPNLELMLYLLTAHGHAAQGCHDGREGLDAVRSNPPDLVLCDIQLPKLSGYEVVQQLKADAALRPVPVVAVTAMAMRGDREKTLTTGFDGYIEKPITPETFVAQVESFLPAGLQPGQSAAIAAAAAAAAAAAGSGSAAQVAPLMPNPYRVLVVDDIPDNLELTRNILEHGGYEVIAVPSGEAALAQLRERRFDLIVCDVHMPGMDGLALCRVVQADNLLRTIPFVFVTSTAHGESTRRAARELGASRFIQRPIEPALLLGEIAACLPGTEKK